MFHSSEIRDITRKSSSRYTIDVNTFRADSLADLFFQKPGNIFFKVLRHDDAEVFCLS